MVVGGSSHQSAGAEAMKGQVVSRGSEVGCRMCAFMTVAEATLRKEW